MSFINLDNFKLNLDDRIIEAFIDAINKRVGDGVKLDDAIKGFVDGDFTIDTLEATAVSAIQEFAAGKNEKLRPLFNKVSKIAKSDSSNTAEIGWPKLEATKAFAENAKDEGYEYSLNLDAEASAVFKIDQTAKAAPFKSSLSFKGKLGLVGNAKAINTKGSVGLGINAGASRALIYNFEHKGSSYVGHALASALSGVIIPTDAKALDSRMRATEAVAILKSVKISGDSSLGGKLDIAAKFPTQYGTPGILLSGFLSLGKGYECLITSVSGSKANVRLQSSSQSLAGKGFNAGLTYTVGLSTILPSQARDLLKFATKVHEAITKIDEYAQENIPSSPEELVTSVLKPGDWVKKEISERIEEGVNSLRGNVSEDATVLYGLARLLGVGDLDNSALNTADLKMAATDQLTELIVEFIDGRMDVFNINPQEIAEDVTAMLGSTVDPKVIAILNKQFFKEIKTELNDRLEEISSNLDQAVIDKFTELDVLTGPGSRVSKLKAFISEARSVSEKVLDAVSKAQTDLLSAEIGYEYAKSGAMKAEFTVEFNASMVAGQKGLRDAIINPSTFIDRALSKDVKGIDIVETLISNKIKVESGPRWGVTFINVPLSYKSKSVAELNVEQSVDGVEVGFGSRVEKQKKFWNETRKLSFISAANIVQAQEQNYMGAGKDDDVGSSPVFKLAFEEDDPNVSVGEIRKLLKEFRNRKVIDKVVHDAIVADVKAATEAGFKKVVTTVSVGIPSSTLDALLDRLASKSPPIREREIKKMQQSTSMAIAVSEEKEMKALDDISQELVDDSNLGLRTLSSKKISDMTINERAEFLMTLARLENDIFASGRPGTPRLNKIKRERLKEHKAAQKMIATIAGISNIMEATAELAKNITVPTPQRNPENYKAKMEAFNEHMISEQKRINEIAKKFMCVKNPSPFSWWGGKVKSTTVVLYKAVQEYMKDKMEVRPPLIITIDFEGREQKTYIAPAIES